MEKLSSIIVKDALRFAFNKHATHVLIKFIKIAEISPYLDGIYDVICKNFQELSSDPNGLPLIKNSIVKFYTEQKKAKMIRELSKLNIIVI